MGIYNNLKGVGEKFLSEAVWRLFTSGVFEHLENQAGSKKYAVHNCSNKVGKGVGGLFFDPPQNFFQKGGLVVIR